LRPWLCAIRDLFTGALPEHNVATDPSNQAWGYEQELGFFNYYQPGYAVAVIPPATDLKFAQVDARIPNQVYWSIGNSQGVYQVTFHIDADSGCCGVFQFTDGQTVVTDQMRYSNGSLQAYLMGRNYGIEWRANPSQTRFLYRPDDQIFPGKYFWWRMGGG
jgi:hypothetical protein